MRGPSLQDWGVHSSNIDRLVATKPTQPELFQTVDFADFAVRTQRSWLLQSRPTLLFESSKNFDELANSVVDG